ncbi:2-C-methyl-D-erythritol 4-phosphate cytidylyltransferase [Inconstantimicrobium mannanitabidum]|uniref:2-C-methyl-D-erythritol 4-phosphate cytidylyltransferase n=1 Tax=Inconstantimicrobium mannanitabidum TaxID=1604901 RepID=A0ACB5RI86_9CLOT|nr:2-C-methyl-D-erythritol 4-phosphate cytidylyltransferase [Clostridium sp. TW13]GKX68794.1 2-C-methyl-D-erythritol 4-phosphate cytidylyltransferase [Clostridium sp. TW13]
MKKVAAIILAGGRGTRMNMDKSKQFLSLNGKPLIYYTIKAFEQNPNVDSIILVLPKNEIDYCVKEVIQKYNLKIDDLVEGGKERQDSVYNALNRLQDCDVVLIHDGARPFVTTEIIDKGIEFAKLYGAAAPGVTPKDTIKVKDKDNFSISTPERSSLVAIQTPQCFRYDIIKKCHDNIKENQVQVTDDTMAVERYAHKVYIYEGEYTNIKVTTPEDLIIAEHLAAQV